MSHAMANSGYQIASLVHADLGRVEWKESLEMCERTSLALNVPMAIVRRRDGLDMLSIWQRRMHQLAGQDKPFWSSSAARYCTSDLKRDPIDAFYRNCGENFIISCEGIRAQESSKRAQKNPLEIRTRVTSEFYKGMTVEQAIAAYRPDKRLVLTWLPIFNYSVEDVWNTCGNSCEDLLLARAEYKATGLVPASWAFHPAYVYGNERVSCTFCVLGSLNDLQNGAQHNPELLQEMISMEDESGYTFKQGWSLRELLN